MLYPPESRAQSTVDETYRIAEILLRDMTRVVAWIWLPGWNGFTPIPFTNRSEALDSAQRTGAKIVFV